MQWLTLNSGCQVRIEDSIPGNVKVLLIRRGHEPELIGTYWDRNDAICGIEEAERLHKTTVDATWVIRSAKDCSGRVPVFTSVVAGATAIGEASTKEEADMLLAPRRAMFVADTLGPDGNEGWVPV